MSTLAPIDPTPHLTWKRESTRLLELARPRMGRPQTLLSSAASRVQQLDAVRLDGELMMLLNYQLMNVIRIIGLDVDRWKPEIQAILPALMYCATILSNMPTPGMMLQNLRFSDERDSTTKIRNFMGDSASARGTTKGATNVVYGGPMPAKGQRILLGLLSIGLSWGWKRLEAHVEEHGWAQMCGPEFSTHQRMRGRLTQLLQRTAGLLAVLSCVHHLHFLATGAYRGIPERLLQMRLVQAEPDGMQKLRSFEYMNRQLVWRIISDFLIFIMTVVDFKAFFRRISGAIQDRRRVSAAALARAQELADRDACPVCGADDIGTTYALVGCGHVYCYYCLAEKCPALVLAPEDVPATKKSSQVMRCMVCQKLAQQAIRKG